MQNLARDWPVRPNHRRPRRDSLVQQQQQKLGDAWPPLDHPFQALTSLPYWGLRQRDCRLGIVFAHCLTAEAVVCSPSPASPWCLLEDGTRAGRWLMYHITCRLALIWGDKGRLGRLPRHPLPFSYQGRFQQLCQTPLGLSARFKLVCVFLSVRPTHTCAVFPSMQLLVWRWSSPRMPWIYCGWTASGSACGRSTTACTIWTG